MVKNPVLTAFLTENLISRLLTSIFSSSYVGTKWYVFKPDATAYQRPAHPP